MTEDQEPTNLEELLDRMEESARDGNEVDLGTITEAVGRRSFGPLLLVPGLVAVSPLSGIPGAATTLGIFVTIIAGQLLFGRKYFWLPRWLLKRSVTTRRFRKALKFLRPPARFVDRFLRPRMAVFTGRVGTYGIAILCALIAIAMPPMEIIPFSVTIAGAALSTFGLALIARDGLLALIALAWTVAGVTLVVVSLF